MLFVMFFGPFRYRNGRHWVRVELSTILIKYAFKISIQFWSRRDNSVVPLA